MAVNFEAMCDDAVESLIRGNFGRLERAMDKLDHLKTTAIRTLLNNEELELMQTEETDFNERFRNAAAGSSALIGEEDEPSPKHAVLASGSFDSEMHREMMLQKRNIMMRLRMGDAEHMKYDIVNTGFDSELVEKRFKKGASEAFQKRQDKRDERQMRRHQRVLNQCTSCFYNDGESRSSFDRDLVVAESETCYVAFPGKISPLFPPEKEPLTHLVLAPKQHYPNCLEIDEQVQTEMRNFQKSLVAFYQDVFKMQAVFIETSIQSETGHA